MAAQHSLSAELCVLLVIALTGSSLAEENFQKWSLQTYYDDPASFMCNDTDNPIFINTGDILTWRRLGHDSEIVNDDHFELRPASGVANMELSIKKATDQVAGIYFCEIRTGSGDYVGRIIKALNLGGHKYDDAMDKYRTNIITGAIAGGAVFFLLVSICAIDNFRYQSQEERQERREAKQERLRKRHQFQHGAYDNPGMHESAVAGNGMDKNGLNRMDDMGPNGMSMMNTQL